MVEVLLLSKNKKQIRIASAHLLKGIYESSKNQSRLFKFLIDQIPHVKKYGVNSNEFLTTFGYITND